MNNYVSVIEEFIKRIEYFSRKVNFQFYQSKEIESFIISFLDIFIKEDFILPEEYYKTLIRLNAHISNLVFISGLNTDTYIQTCLYKEQKKIKSFNNFIKILTLYSSKNQII